ncbi:MULTISPECIES: O-antigen ligase family protein [Calothrix]|uniref:O-antigen ligase family protein n=2 Tax=Calothrix TaxID=1186 RepID=A0ABR8ACA7_9CYAN|nr:MULTISPECIES: O-antigen ligase [Calothrix]MBD2197359.1 O-antigen ligase family protein [Calothrix parietina FACHB-288]MBD2228183.1 O-antigen ligase family protein [Calothrix anomala FACHB-343]
MKINKKEFLLNSEKIFTIVCLLFYSGGPLTLILSGGASEGDSDEAPTDTGLIQLVFMVIYLITCILLLLRWKKAISILSKVKFTWLIIFLSALSIFWSAAPQVTIVRTVALFGTSLFGMYLASRYTLKEQMELINWMFCVAIILGLLFAIALPKYGLMGGLHSGALRGIYTHKNVFGKILSLGGVNCLLVASANKRNSLFTWAIFGIAIICLILARSSSSMLSFTNLIVIFLGLRILRSPVIAVVPALSAISIICINLYLFVTSNLNNLLGSIGKDATLTGRGDLWPLVWDKIWERPWLGYGFSGFWQGLDGESASVWYASRWTPPNSHNGFLDLWLDLGLIGVVIFFIGFFVLLCKCFKYIRITNTSEGFWPAICLFYLIMINLTETSLLIQNNIFWILYVSTEVSMIVVSNKKIKCLYSL